MQTHLGLGGADIVAIAGRKVFLKEPLESWSSLIEKSVDYVGRSSHHLNGELCRIDRSLVGFPNFVFVGSSSPGRPDDVRGELIMEDRVVKVPVYVGFLSLLAHRVGWELPWIDGLRVCFDYLGLLSRQGVACQAADKDHPPTPFLMKANKDENTKKQN